MRTLIIVCSGSAPPATGDQPVDHDAYLRKPLQAGLLLRTLAEHGVLTERVRRYTCTTAIMRSPREESA
jgi:hypothetical protein